MTLVSKKLALAISLIIAVIPNIVQARGSMSPFGVESVTPLTKMTRAFHSDKRFCGADGACSIPLDETSTLWLFGDSFIRKGTSKSSIGKDTGDSFAFINNSAAVQNIDTGAMKFFWKQTNKSPDALMRPAGHSGAYFWPGDGFVIDEKLFIVNKFVVPKLADAKDPNAFNFEWKSDVLLQITNGGMPPTQWKWKSADLPEKSRSVELLETSAKPSEKSAKLSEKSKSAKLSKLSNPVLIGTACYLSANHAYFYTSVQKDAYGTNVHPTGVARIAVKDLLSMNMSKFSFWDGAKWNPDSSKSKVIIEDGASEMTVTKLNGEPYLVATYLAPLSYDVCMRFSKSPEGPWSNPIKVYECPEHNIKVLGRKCSVYSAKAHPEFSKSKREIIFSYCSNPGGLKNYLARPDLYYPHLIRVQLSPELSR